MRNAYPLQGRMILFLEPNNRSYKTLVHYNVLHVELFHYYYWEQHTFPNL